MKWLVCGGRSYADRGRVYRFLDALLADDAGLVIGCGYNPMDGKYQGADQLAYEWAKSRGVRGCAYPAHWTAFRRAAGPIRNRRQLAMFKPDAVAAFPGGRGTADMTQIAREAGVEVIEVRA